jgi:hypothetical protein
MKQITLRIAPNGQIEAQTHGIKGTACLPYIRILEQLTGAVAVDSDFTKEYREVDCPETVLQEEESVCDT